MQRGSVARGMERGTVEDCPRFEGHQSLLGHNVFPYLWHNGVTWDVVINQHHYVLVLLQSVPQLNQLWQYSIHQMLKTPALGTNKHSKLIVRDRI